MLLLASAHMGLIVVLLSISTSGGGALPTMSLLVTGWLQLCAAAALQPVGCGSIDFAAHVALETVAKTVEGACPDVPATFCPRVRSLQCTVGCAMHVVGVVCSTSMS